MKANWLDEKIACNWEDFDKYTKTDEYLPDNGEGDNKATQTATAVSKLIYKWFNDGDVYDNVHSNLEGWANDLSSYANWLSKYVTGMKNILEQIRYVNTEEEYKKILIKMIECAESQYDKLVTEPKVGSVYDCNGYFEFKIQDYSDDVEDEEF